ncbi:UDP-glycosyltransferase 87A1-like isoform X2 [Abrus precatorius]|uniref:UDP-glycosyltransferase 87A1-like isoform X2 n=1 Tax=Abrus precatorius TaxID=3816 RepID=A0A8B8JNS4_ABRPR|nr:UDP-glycosyltransferase 87A1-like isoform X2 [Abrus precatorius]
MEGPIPVSPTIARHVMAVPYPGRGHVNPMMNLCKLLVSKNPNILVTFVVTEEWLGFVGSDPKPDNIKFASIPNVIPSEHNRANDFVNFLQAVMTKMEAPFDHLLHRLDLPPTMIIYDTYLFWVVRVANRRSIPVASFFPMSASFFSLLTHYRLLDQNGHYPVNGEKRVDYIPGNTSIRLADFPNNDGSWQSRKLLQMSLDIIPWVHKAQYLLFSSVYELEPKAIDALKAEFSIPIYTIAPVIPYCGNGQIDGSLSTNHADLGYFQWLDNQPSGSVLYISQGSFLSVSSEQIDEIAAGLRDSGVRFLWIARLETSRLKELCGDSGLVLPWCDQLRVLQHPAIGGFWSHCGWNSTKEGIFSAVPFLTSPILMDQPLNSKYIVEDWKIGWRVNEEVQQNTLIKRDEIASLVKKFMDLGSDEARDMRKRARELQQLCRNASASGGSSETNMNAFLGHILHVAKP